MKCREQRNETGWLFWNYVVSQSWEDQFARVGVCLILSKQILNQRQLFNQFDVPKTSQKHNVSEVLGGFWVATISETLTFETEFSQNFFLPFVPLGSACGLASGRGSRGNTPLHLAAREGHDCVVERLLEAKAAMGANNKKGRGLGRGLGGEPLEGGIIVRQWIKMFIFLFLFVPFLWKMSAKIFAPTFGCVYFFCTPFFAEYRPDTFYFGLAIHILERPLQSKNLDTFQSTLTSWLLPAQYCEMSSSEFMVVWHTVLGTLIKCGVAG